MLRSLNDVRIVLASKSPRRRDILNRLGLSFECIGVTTFSENLDKSTFSSASAYAMETAARKNGEIVEKVLKEGTGIDTIVLAADTVVVSSDGTILEKPADEKSAIEMLSKLSGSTCRVVTGVAIALLLRRSEQAIEKRRFHESTDLIIDDLDRSIIETYVKTGEGVDKAGGLAYQGLGGALVRSINGCYYNVVGLPLNRLVKELRAVARVRQHVLETTSK